MTWSSLRMRMGYWGIAKRAAHNPILMFTMGKTGTTSLGQALPVATGRPVSKLHRVTRDGISRFRLIFRPYDAPIMHRHLVGNYWRWRLRFDGTQRDVVTGVREPMGRLISSFFQVGGFLGFFDDDPDPHQDLAPLVKSFETFFASQIAWDFFTDEFKPGLGIDVYAHAFDPEKGCVTLKTGRFRVFIFRFEDIAAVCEGPLPEFLECAAPIELPRSNAGSDKGYAALYRRFKKEAVFPKWLLDAVYERPIPQHFYTEAERAKYRALWTR